jgi:cathepsin L
MVQIVIEKFFFLSTGTGTSSLVLFQIERILPMRVLSQLFRILSLCNIVSAYLSFEEWSVGKQSYATEDERRHRKAIFESNLEKIVMHNNDIRKKRHYTLGINEFMDLEDHELPLGYDKSSFYPTITMEERRLKDQIDFESLLPIIHPVNELPKSVDWRFAATPVKDQGACGSCWAFASTAALESHLFLNEGLLFSLSVQQLVSCAPNIKQCGGEGGCTGATSVQAYDYLKTAGVVQEWKFGYSSYSGSSVACPLFPKSNSSSLVQGTVATIEGFVALPSNNYTVMMNAVAKIGPIVISVAAKGWGLYERGIFRHAFSTPEDADVNHAVVLMGYGTDDDTGDDYWLVRNSWSPLWGEAGYIRLFREDPASLDHDPCAMDITPGDGDACKYDNNGNPIEPLPHQKVCGTSAVYSAGYIPIGVKKFVAKSG